MRGIAGLKRMLIALPFLSTLAACSMEPVYVRPEIPAHALFKELPPSRDKDASGNWKIAEPAESAHRGAWWKVFADPALDALEQEAMDANQNLKAAAARILQSRALTQAASAERLPSLAAGAGATRQRVSPASQSLPNDAEIQPQTLWRAQATASYELDLFGRASANVHAAAADQEQSDALFRSLQLALQADVAQHYFRLRALDRQSVLYRQTVMLREDTLRLVEHRFNEGEIDEFDVSRARNEAASARAGAVGIARQRAMAEHSLATLLGKIPADFSFPDTPLDAVLVQIPAGISSSLLERRPDIAAAERAIAAANARIGVAKSAYFPTIDMTGALGYESATLKDLFNWSSRTFLLGPLVGTALTVPIFDGGRRQANLEGAQAKLDEAAANYQQQVLVAFREVEDSLATLRLLGEQTREQQIALKASENAEKLSQARYREGESNLIDVMDVQRQVLQSQLLVSELTGARAIAAVNLIRALGGGWARDGDDGLASIAQRQEARQ
ncbi:efflux transporter outer membrane subunit [Herbaspirillum sp. WKF16]|uniref:efflux transporter outer membrane subunit n=1 Tax=Herbaspirillum sp. WKF16 TaxID=3028312 RepID=UPI0023A9BBFD|nr:efflux transporter outer membrane subunit [Herbaspirillum sp. WKF16]WDZ98378.1 efflux transporter outer membrane subunit [Herbaspirillum sp. WKF16]